MQEHDSRSVPSLAIGGVNAPLMSSREIAELCGKRHDNVMRDIRGYVSGGVLKTEETPYVEPTTGQTYKEFRLNKRDTLLVVSGYNAELRAKIIDRWMELEAAPAPRMLTTTETLIQMLQLQAEVERRQAETEQAVNRLEHRIDEVAHATAFKVKPSAAESITHIRERIGRDYGLSASVIDEVMRQMPYAPKPAGMVRNDHESADGSHYAVYWKKDITKTFDRFVKECTPATQFMHTHPFLEGRFRVARKSVVR